MTWRATRGDADGRPTHDAFSAPPDPRTVMKTVVITQSNYIPWRGYFAMLAEADEIVLLDVVQYTTRDWRNRNAIKSPSGPLWLTIPVAQRRGQSIDEARVADRHWAERHIRCIEFNYRRAHAFDQIAPWLFTRLREASTFAPISEINGYLIQEMFNQLRIERPIRRCTDLIPRQELAAMNATDRLVALCRTVSATHYLTGPSARNYLETDRFEGSGIAVKWMDYSGFSPYPQCWSDFEPNVSVIDLLLNCGSASPRFLARNPPDNNDAPKHLPAGFARTAMGTAPK
jgi:hypothetical protein